MAGEKDSELWAKIVEEVEPCTLVIDISPIFFISASNSFSYYS